MADNFRASILAKLKERNRVETKPFVDLVTLQNRAAERSASLHIENGQLSYINDKLKEENSVLKKNPADNVDTSVLEKKLFAVQEELTELHRRKGENAQLIIDQSAQLRGNEVAQKESYSKLQQCHSELNRLREEMSRMKSTVTELEATNQLLKDEYQTLQLALTSAERKLVSAQKENDLLVAQIMEFKDRDVMRLNQENDKAMQVQQERIKQQLEEAARDPSRHIATHDRKSTQQIGSATDLDSTICYAVRIPTKCYLKFEAHDGEVNAVKWSPHGLTVATGGSDRKIKMWDLSKHTAEQRGSLSGSNGAILSIDYDAAGSLLLASSSDFASRVWTVDDGRLRHTLTGHSNKVLAAKFMGDSNKVVSASYDRTLKVWDLRSKACVSTKFPGSSCNDLVCSDNNIISGHFDKKVRFWDVRTGTEPISEVTLGGKITSVDLSRNGFWLLACSRDDTVRLIDLRTVREVRSFYTEGFQVGCDWTRASFSPDSEYFSVGAASGTVYIWNVNDHTRLEKSLLGEHTSPVVAVAWQPAGNCLTTCDKAKTVVVWAAI